MDVHDSFRAMATNGASGHIIWGSSNDFKTKQKCIEFHDYLINILGPAVLEVKKLSRKLRDTTQYETIDVTGHEITNTEFTYQTEPYQPN